MPQGVFRNFSKYPLFFNVGNAMLYLEKILNRYLGFMIAER